MPPPRRPRARRPGGARARPPRRPVLAVLTQVAEPVGEPPTGVASVGEHPGHRSPVSRVPCLDATTAGLRLVGAAPSRASTLAPSGSVASRLRSPAWRLPPGHEAGHVVPVELVPPRDAAHAALDPGPVDRGVAAARDGHDGTARRPRRRPGGCPRRRADVRSRRGPPTGRDAAGRPPGSGGSTNRPPGAPTGPCRATPPGRGRTGSSPPSPSPTPAPTPPGRPPPPRRASTSRFPAVR